MIDCPKCGLQNSETDNFCRHCGAPLNEQGKMQQISDTDKPVPPIESQPAAVSGTSATANERTLWEAYPSFRTAFPTLLLIVILYIIIAVVLHVALSKNSNASSEMEGLPAYEAIGFVVFAGIFILVALIHAVRLRSMKYRLTTQRIFLQRGLINKRIDEVELERYRDIFINQDFLDRMVGCGDIKVVTSDVTNATVDIIDVTDPVGKKELIRAAARERQKALGIIRREEI